MTPTEKVSMRKLLLPAAIALAAMAMVAAGCGDDDDSSNDSVTVQTQPSEQSQPSEGSTEAAEAEQVKPAAGEADIDKKPKVAKGKGDPPSKLKAEDLIVGKGTAAKAGDTVTVRYVGVRFDDGKQFDASWDRPGKSFDVPLGAGAVIPGWDQGIVGMKVGGRRKLIIPPDLAYGAQGYPPDIPPDSTLIFVIDLKKIA
jgi:peptidylprolyl isomerase